MRRQEPGEGIIERGRQGCCFSSSRCVLSRLLWCAFVPLYINFVCVCVFPWDKTECAVLEHSLLNIGTVCLLYNEITSFVGFFFFSVHTTLWQKQENYELKEEDGDRERSARDGDSIVSEGSLY